MSCVNLGIYAKRELEWFPVGNLRWPTVSFLDVRSMPGLSLSPPTWRIGLAEGGSRFQTTSPSPPPKKHLPDSEKSVTIEQVLAILGHFRKIGGMFGTFYFASFWRSLNARALPTSASGLFRADISILPKQSSRIWPYWWGNRWYFQNGFYLILTFIECQISSHFGGWPFSGGYFNTSQTVLPDLAILVVIMK